MKKFVAILMTLCMLCGACCAMADMEIPTWDSMPGVVSEIENMTVDEAAFQGEWILDTAFLDTEYLGREELDESFGFNFMPICIADRRITQDVQNEFGEFVTLETSYEFEGGQIVGKDGRGQEFAIELLENGNIVLSVFYPEEGDTVKCLSLFLVHPVE
jgi:hypothetical protein